MSKHTRNVLDSLQLGAKAETYENSKKSFVSGGDRSAYDYEPKL
jgi:hypothetical protein